MESPFYSYLYVKTQCLDVYWQTLEIQNLLNIDQRLITFISNACGHFKSDMPFLSIQLMCVKNYDSWSNHDYHPLNTNYIAMVTNKIISPEVQQLLYSLSLFLNADVIEENDDGDAIFISARRRT